MQKNMLFIHKTAEEEENLFNLLKNAGYRMVLCGIFGRSTTGYLDNLLKTIPIDSTKPVVIFMPDFAQCQPSMYNETILTMEKFKNKNCVFIGCSLKANIDGDEIEFPDEFKARVMKTNNSKIVLKNLEFIENLNSKQSTFE